MKLVHWDMFGRRENDEEGLEIQALPTFGKLFRVSI